MPTAVTKSYLPESWGLLYAAFSFSQGIGLLTYWTLPIMTGALLSGLNLSGAQVGLVGTTEFAGLLLASLCLAPFVDRIQRRKVALIGVAAVFSANVLTALFAEQFLVLAGLRCLAGIGAGLCLAIGNATIANARDPEQFSGHMTFATIAFMVVILAGLTQLSVAFGVRGVFFGLAGVVAFCGCSLGALPTKPASVVSAGNTDGGISLLAGSALVVLSVALLFGLRDTLPWLVAERLGVDAGMSVGSVGALFSVMYAISLIGPALLLILSRRLNPKTILLWAMVLTGCFAMVFTLSNGNAVQFSAGMIIWSTIYFIAFAQLNAVGAMIDRSGRLVSAIGSGFIAGVMLGPIVGGVLLDNSGYSAIGSAELALTGLIGALIVFGLRQRAILSQSAAA